MQAGIADIAMIAMRSEPSHRSEMASQLVFGETYSILEEQHDWLLVRSDWDGYEGWISRNAHTALSSADSNKIRVSDAVYSTDPVLNAVQSGKAEPFRLSFGSRLPFIDREQGTFRINTSSYGLPHSCSLSTSIIGNIRTSVTVFARAWLNAPYLWGGKTIFGTDCSGFVQTLFRVHGIYLHRDARKQSLAGAPVNLLSESHPGDLAFFDNDEGEITHVGIITQSGHIIHASTMVREDLLDHQGIYQDSLKRYTHRLRLIKDCISK